QVRRRYHEVYRAGEGQNEGNRSGHKEQKHADREQNRDQFLVEEIKRDRVPDEEMLQAVKIDVEGRPLGGSRVRGVADRICEVFRFIAQAQVENMLEPEREFPPTED